MKERPRDKPFFLYVCFNVPHGAGTRTMKQFPTDDALYRTAYRDVQGQMPLPPAYIAEKDVTKPKIPRATYSGVQIPQYDYRKTPAANREHGVRVCQTVEGIDRVLSKVQARLEELGLADNTIIIYSADNGILHGDHGYGGKCLLYENSIRVPLIIYDPRQPKEKQGLRPQELALSTDVGPTILDLCGIPVPSVMEGKSLRPILNNEKAEWRADFFCESLILLQDYPPCQSVRSGEWKYIRYWPNGGWPKSRPGNDYRNLLNLGLNGETPSYEELFHLADDHHETKNLAGDPAHKARLEAMRARCIELQGRHRGDPETLSGVPQKDAAKEFPAAWNDLL